MFLRYILKFVSCSFLTTGVDVANLLNILPKIRYSVRVQAHACVFILCSLSVHVCICICVCVHVLTCMCMWRPEVSQRWVLSSIALHLIGLRQELSLNLKLTDLAGLAGRQAQGSSCLSLPGVGRLAPPCLAFSHGG